MDWLHTELFMLLMPVTIESPFLIDSESVPISFNARSVCTSQFQLHH